MRLLVTAVFAFTVVGVTGCATVNETYLADGRKGYSISCDGAAVGMNVCFEKAGELCGARGYDLLNREGQVISSATAVGQSNGSTYVQYGAFNTKSIMLACK